MIIHPPYSVSVYPSDVEPDGRRDLGGVDEGRLVALLLSLLVPRPVLSELRLGGLEEGGLAGVVQAEDEHEELVLLRQGLVQPREEGVHGRVGSALGSRSNLETSPLFEVCLLILCFGSA